MRKYDTSAISTTVAAPFKGGTHVHLQLANQEVLNALALNLVGPSAQTNKVYILFGCVNTGTGLHFIISAGAVYYNGEVYLVDAVNFTATGSNTAVANIVTTFFSDVSADPVQFTDGEGRNIHQIRKIVLTTGASGSTIANYTAFLKTSITLVNDQEPTLGANYTVKFDQDKAVFFVSATVDSEITFDFTNAIPGAVVRLKWTWVSGGRVLTITPGSGAVAYAEGGDITRADGATNTMYFIYVGKNEAAQNEVGYSISQVA